MREIVAVIIIVVAFAAMGSIPGSIARRRGHVSAEAISLCAWIGVIIWPCWLIAFIWAHTGLNRHALQPMQDAAGLARGMYVDPIPKHWEEKKSIEEIDAEIEARIGGRR